MNKLKKLTVLFLTMLVVILSVPTVTVFANNDDIDMRYGRKQLGKMPNGANMQTVYDELVTGCGQGLTEINIGIGGLNIDVVKDFETIFSLFYSDYPEYFWLNNGGYNVSYNQNSIVVNPTYNLTGDQLENAKLLYNTKVNSFINDLSGSDYDKAKTLHDRLINATEYQTSQNDQNAYGALVDGKAVCNGYARAYQHLLLEAGIPAWYVSGKSINPVTNITEGHAWNVVKLDNNWYYTDITWDDQSPTIYYEYFNVSSEQLLKDHQIDDFYKTLVPSTANSDAVNYYKKNSLVFDKYNQDKFVQILKTNGLTAHIYIDGDVNKFFDSLDENLLSIGEQLGATGTFKVSYSSLTLKKAVVLNFLIEDSKTPIITTTPSTSSVSSVASSNNTSSITSTNKTPSSVNSTSQSTSNETTTTGNQIINTEQNNYINNQKSINTKSIVIGSSSAFIIVAGIVLILILTAKK